MRSMNKPIVLVNFGGPRAEDEIRSFLTELLCDPDVIRTSLPTPLQNLLFKRIAAKRSLTIREEYEKMGGASPIYQSTETIRDILCEKLNTSVFTFHRYIPSSHKQSLAAIDSIGADEICIFPLFPQFSYATTGSIARLFLQNLHPKTLQKLRWIPSYYNHSAYIQCFTDHIKAYLHKQNLNEKDITLFFTPHGVPTEFICTGDPYQKECEASYKHIMKAFPKTHSLLAYQSKFGPKEWIKPYTDKLCESILDHTDKPIVFIPLSFTSDHIETLVEIEDLYVKEIEKQGLKAYRCPAFNESSIWIDAIINILQSTPCTSTAQLIRNENIKCPKKCKRELCPYVQPLVSLDQPRAHLSKTFY